MHAAVAVTGRSIASVAELLGVSVPTLRSWERRYGVGPTQRTEGGHRRYALADIERLQRLRRLIADGMPTASAAAAVQRSDTAGSPRRRVRRDSEVEFALAVDAIDGPRIARAAATLLRERGVEDAWTSVFVPTLIEVGTRWLTADTGIACEHVLTDALRDVLVRHQAAALRQPAARPEVLVAA